ncbi:hypothetical protein Agub_g5689 [Astrephomene gubernaculifera]|uniref:Nuclear nucleic acid-binding protein C1D n=1 Tax=Astrephomene gubernaculifera TaxID=47775 RepID=A0AAD3DP59_9CHLO|nr:hypothetical protein Agub_g5689 [Astrephomene gubernaculifera]
MSLPTPASSALELPDDVEFQLGEFKRLLSELQKALQATHAMVPGPADLSAVAEPLERARLCMALAKTVNSLHHVYLRAHGRDPFAPSSGGASSTISVGRQELDRIRQYDKKLTRAVQDAEVRASRPVLSLNVAAASRFIDAAIPDLTEEQRGALKRAAQAADAKRGGKGGNKKPRSGPGGAGAAGGGASGGTAAPAAAATAAPKPKRKAAATVEVEAERDAVEKGGNNRLEGGPEDSEAAVAAAGREGEGAAGEGGEGGSGGARAAAQQFLASFAAAQGL